MGSFPAPKEKMENQTIQLNTKFQGKFPEDRKEEREGVYAQE